MRSKRMLWVMEVREIATLAPKCVFRWRPLVYVAWTRSGAREHLVVLRRDNGGRKFRVVPYVPAPKARRSR